MSDATPDATQGDSRRDSRGDVSRDTATVTEAAKRLRVTVRTVQRRLDRGELNSIEADGKRLVVLPSEATAGATADATGDTTAGDTGGAFMAHLVEENTFLRGLVEQRDRDAAELRAALRTALNAMPKALPESSAPDALQAPQSVQAAPAGNQAQPVQSSPQRAPRRKPAFLWQRWFGR